MTEKRHCECTRDLSSLLIREQVEKREEALSPYAAKSSGEHLRPKKEPLDPVRTCWAIDRDRIIHSNAFRREEGKTQVFILPHNDHLMNRLTHTMEVAQVAKSLASALSLNNDLTEAIAFGHDTAHTCFGHAGERTLNKLNPKGYIHAEEAERRLNVLSELNITDEVIDGIRHHSGLTNFPQARTLEGQLAPYADKIAYLTSDISNAIKMGIIADIPERFRNTLGYSKPEIVETLINGVIDASVGKDRIQMDEDVFTEFQALREFAFNEIYYNPDIVEENRKSELVVEYLFEYYMKHPEVMPHYNEGKARKRQVTDYIAGMTDRYAMSMFTKSWN